MGFRGSRVQIPPSRLSEDQALQRLSLWGFFFACTPCCEFCCESRLSRSQSAASDATPLASPSRHRAADTNEATSLHSSSLRLPSHHVPGSPSVRSPTSGGWSAT